MTRTDTDHDAILAEIISDVLHSGVRLGDYQRSLLTGGARWSGADLKGKAKRWGSRYRIARDRAFDLAAAEAARRGYRLYLSGGTAKEGPLTLALVPLA
jgi:hypothetical protein